MIERVHPIGDQGISRNRINPSWLRDEIFECLNILYQCDVNVRATVSDNHQSNASTFKKSTV